VSPRRKAAHTPAESSRASLVYVYGIGGAGMRTDGAPAGIDGHAVTAIESGGLAALVSALDADTYSPGNIAAGVGEVEWIAPRAGAHDAVVTWASQPGPVVPLHMWTLFADGDAVGEMLTKRASEVRPLLERLRDSDEYGLRVFANAAKLVQVAERTDANLAELRRSAADVGPGQKYLIERKLDGARRGAARARARGKAGTIYERLAKHAREAATDQVPAPEAGEPGAILSAAFLVPRGNLRDFRAALTELVREYEPQGLRFAFTGPWPAYHFSEGGDGESTGTHTTAGGVTGIEGGS